MSKSEITAAVQRDTKGVATHYEMKAGDRHLGRTTRGEKGDFTFQPLEGMPALKLLTAKTMRDIKTGISAMLPP